MKITEMIKVAGGASAVALLGIKAYEHVGAALFKTTQMQICEHIRENATELKKRQDTYKYQVLLHFSGDIDQLIDTVFRSRGIDEDEWEHNFYVQERSRVQAVIADIICANVLEDSIRYLEGEYIKVGEPYNVVPHLIESLLESHLENREDFENKDNLDFQPLTEKVRTFLTTST